MRLALAFLLLCIFLSNCTTDPEEKLEITDADRVWHICEGTFNWDNASIGYSKPNEEGYSESVYEQVNREPLGDVLHSMYEHNSLYWLVVNNSSKIVLVDKTTFEKQGEISGLTSPRHVAFFQNKAFVSDLYADKIFVYNTSTLNLVDEITVDGWVEFLMVHENELWCFHQEKPNVFIYETTSLEPLDTLQTAIRCGGIVKTSEHVTAIYDGTLGSQEDVEIFQINLASHEIINTNSAAHEGLKFLVKTDKGYASMKIDGIQLFDEALNAEKNVSIDYEGVPYGFGVHLETQEFYLSTAPSFTDKARIYIYDQNGNQETVYRAGVNCNGFFFE